MVSCRVCLNLGLFKFCLILRREKFRCIYSAGWVLARDLPSLLSHLTSNFLCNFWECKKASPINMAQQAMEKESNDLRKIQKELAKIVNSIQDYILKKHENEMVRDVLNI